MTNEEKILKILRENNGIITTKEVKETIDHVVYYDKVKNEILKNINYLIKEVVSNAKYILKSTYY